MAIQYLDCRGNSIPVTGRFLAHNHLNQIHRAFLAADLHAGVKQLTGPTMVQAAHLARVNVTYARWADKRSGERTAILAGDLPLVPPRIKPTNGAEAIVLQAIKELGADRVLDLACLAEAPVGAFLNGHAG